MRTLVAAVARQATSYFQCDWMKCCLLVAIGFAVRLPAMQGSLIWDDEYLAKENPFIKSPLLILETFRHYLFPEAFSTHYRPVQTISYLFDYLVWNNNTYGFHLSNVFWHVGSGVLLYFLLRRLLGPLLSSRNAPSEGRHFCGAETVAFFLALLWVVHPVHSAAVDYISGRADSLAFFFASAAWLLFLRGRERNYLLGRSSHFALGALCLLLALCSRESALTWVAIFVFYLFVFEKKLSRRAKAATVVACLCLVAIYGGLRQLPRDPRPAPVASTSSGLTRAVLMFRALGDYGRLTVYPNNLHMERTVESPGAALGSVNGWRRSIANEYLSVLGLAVAAALVLGACRRGVGRPIRILGAGWFLVGYLPISNLIELNATVAEHWLYLPSVGLLTFLAGCSLDLPKRVRAFVPALACVFVTCLAVRSLMRSSDWESPETFYRRTIGAGGVKVRVALNLASIYTARGDYVKSESLLRKVLEMSPDYPIARNSLAHVLFKQGKQAEAEALFAAAREDAGEARKDYPKTWVAALNVAHMKRNNHQPEAALEVLDKAVRDYPGTWELIRYQAEILRETRGPEAALQSVQEFARENWWHAGAAIALGKLYYEKGDLIQAEAALQHAARLDVHDAEALNLIARMSLQQDRLDDACATQRRALARQPDEPRQYLILSDILTKMGRNEEAEAMLAQVGRMQLAAQSQPLAN